MKLPELRDFLGTDFSAAPLKPTLLRARNALKPWLIRQPQRAMSYRIETSDGRRLKLLHFGRSIANRHAMVEERLRALASLDCVPTLVWSGPTSLLTEWVEGETPAVADPHFASRLAEIFADLSRVGFEERLTSELPARVPTGTLCGDQNLANFILSQDGALSMIDPASLQPNLPIDIFLVESGGLYDRIDRAAFHESYTRAGGIDFPFTATEVLKLFQLARHCALQSHVLERTPFVEVRRRRNLKRSISGKLDELRSELR